MFNSNNGIVDDKRTIKIGGNMSFDFEFMVADWDNDILRIEMPNGAIHEYSLSVEKRLFDGGKNNGVEYKEIGHPEDAEDIEDENEDYEDYEFWDDDYGWQTSYRRSHTGKSIRGSRW